MKRLFFLLLMAYSTCLTAQPENPGNTGNKPVLSREQFMLKSKNQRTAARILLYGGAGITLTSLVLLAKETDKYWINLLGGETNYNTTTADILFSIGVGSMAGSIPLFIASGKNRRNARLATVSVDMKKLYQVQYASIKSHHYPALSIKLPL